MANQKITALAAGTVKDTDVHVAVDTTDMSMAASGTDKKYLWSALKADVLSDGFDVAATQLLIGAGAGNPPTGNAGLTFATNILTAPTALLKTALRIEDPGAGTNYVAFQAGTLAGNTTYTLPTADGTSGQVLATNGSAVLSWSSVSGDVAGPASATDNALARFDGTTGKLIQNSVAILTDAGALSGLTQLDVDNLELDGNTLLSTDTNGPIILSPDGTGIISCLGIVSTNESFRLVATVGTANTITHTTNTVSTSYTITEAPTPPLIGQVPIVLGVSGTNATMGWSTVPVEVLSTVTTNWTGIWAAPQAGNISATLAGNIVYLQIPTVSASATTSAVVTNTSVLPAGLRPTSTQVCPIFSLVDNSVADLLGQVKIDTSGNITISTGLAGIANIQAGSGSLFGGSGTSGWATITVSYVLS